MTFMATDFHFIEDSFRKITIRIIFYYRFGSKFKLFEVYQYTETHDLSPNVFSNVI